MTYTSHSLHSSDMYASRRGLLLRTRSVSTGEASTRTCTGVYFSYSWTRHCRGFCSVLSWHTFYHFHSIRNPIRSDIWIPRWICCILMGRMDGFRRSHSILSIDHSDLLHYHSIPYHLIHLFIRRISVQFVPISGFVARFGECWWVTCLCLEDPRRIYPTNLGMMNAHNSAYGYNRTYRSAVSSRLWWISLLH